MGRFLSLTASWRSLWRPWISSRLTRLAFARQSLQPSVTDESSSARPRSGVAAKELLLVTAVIGAAAFGLRFLDPDTSHKREAVRAGEVVTLLRREVPLDDEFVCVVSVEELSSRGSPHPPYYMSRVRFARRNSDSSEPYLVEFFGYATGGWQ